MPLTFASIVQLISLKSTAAMENKLAPKTVGFRLDEDHRKLLGIRALKAGTSAHDLARLYVIEALHDRQEIPAMREVIVSLANEVHSLRKNLALATEALLSLAGKVSPTEAQTWAQKTFNLE